IIPVEAGMNYPRCIGGKRAGPPEDCGGVSGYGELLKNLRNPKHKEHEEMWSWVGREFDPEDFNPEDVRFDNPDKRLKNVFR
ncbi:MAG: plasmid pRiA4b ORF-3 family protein, partial [Thermoplasmata archaeon]|nr:plasmid pRiA4b ORF-3 family protein [Thermoplasmata archaeon]